MIFAKFCPECGKLIKNHTTKQREQCGREMSRKYKPLPKPPRVVLPLQRGDKT